MISSDDLQVRCSVRKAKDADGEFGEPEDMTCTMRTWHGGKQPLQELLLKPVQLRTMSAMRTRDETLSPVQVSKRFSSLDGRNRFQMQQEQEQQQQQQRQIVESIGNVKLALTDILIVEKMGQELDDPTILLTTLSDGCLEFSTNENGRAILLAFLKAHLPPERIRITNNPIQRSKSDVSKYSCSTFGNKTYDVEALTSTKVAERIENETMSETLTTKVGRAFSSILEMVECSCISCGGSGSSSIHPEPVLKKKKHSSDKENSQQSKSPNQKLEDCGFSLESEPRLDLGPLPQI